MVVLECWNGCGFSSLHSVTSVCDENELYSSTSHARPDLEDFFESIWSIQKFSCWVFYQIWMWCTFFSATGRKQISCVMEKIRLAWWGAETPAFYFWTMVRRQKNTTKLRNTLQLRPNPYHIICLSHLGTNGELTNHIPKGRRNWIVRAILVDFPNKSNKKFGQIWADEGSVVRASP